MNILVLCHDVPSPTFSETSAVYHLIKDLSSDYNHEIKLLCLDSGKTRADNTIKKFIEGKVKFNPANNMYREILCTTKNMFNFSNLMCKFKSKMLPNVLDYYYSPKMDKKIKSIIKESEFDIIYLTRPMANYVIDINIPKIIQPYDAVYEWQKQIFKASNGFKKFFYGILYLMTKYYEKNVYEKFDACLVVTEEDKKLLIELNPQINCYVVPIGVNTQYFYPMEVLEDYPSLTFLSNMGGSPTTENVLHFYNNIYPMIRKQMPKLKLYLVGRDPVKEIMDLSSDPFVKVTGFVEDVRPYLAKSSVFIAPMILGTGLKYKVLEAMAMQKPVVSTKIGAQGIKAVHGKDMFITDNEKEFAEFVLRLLNDKKLNDSLGLNSRRIIEEEYSWDKIAEKFNEIIKMVTSDKN